MTDCNDVANWYGAKDQQDYEKKRLEVYSPVEFEITKMLIKEHCANIKEPKVLEVGLGFGHYSLFMVKELKAKISLIDITKEFVSHAKKKIEDAGFGSQIEFAKTVGALDIEKNIEKEKYDIVLFLGPLYHLIERKERISALKQVFSVLKKNGIIFLAGLNRIAPFRDMIDFTARNPKFLDNKNFEELLKTGVATKNLGLPIGIAYFHRFEQFIEEIESLGVVEKIECLGTECFSQGKEINWNKLSENNKKKFIGFIRTAQKLGHVYSSDHFLYIGKKK